VTSTNAPEVVPGVVSLARAVNDAAASPGSSGRGVGAEPPEPAVNVATGVLDVQPQALRGLERRVVHLEPGAAQLAVLPVEPLQEIRSCAAEIVTFLKLAV
jgi:hypothetical protein